MSGMRKLAIEYKKKINDLEKENAELREVERQLAEAREELLNYKVKYNNQCSEMNRLKQSRKDQLAMIRKLKEQIEGTSR